MSIDSVRKDLELIFRQKNIERIYLCDSSILLNRQRAKEILRYIIRHCGDKEIIFEFRVEQLDGEIIGLMRQLPNNEYHLGIQTINEDALRIMGRTFDRKKFERAYMKIIKGAECRNMVIDLIYGLPGDDINGYKRSIDYVFSLPAVNRVITNPLIVLPGSEFYSRCDMLGIKLRDKKSFIVSENATFSREDMELARAYSFFISVVYLNSRLVDCIKLMAEERNAGPMDTITEFMRSLPFDISGGLGYPYMTPSIKEDFHLRNRVFRNVISMFDELIDSFRGFSSHRYDTLLSDYRQDYTNHYYRLKKFSGISCRPKK